MADPKQPPWERLKTEGETAYSLFRIYLEQEPPRSIRVLADLTKRSTSTLYKHSTRNDWLGRAEAWDNEQAEAEAEAILSEKAKIARDRLRMINDGLMIVALTLKGKLSSIQGSDAELPELREITHLMDRGLHYERLIMGEATERIEGNRKLHLENLTLEESETLQHLQNKALKKPE